MLINTLQIATDDCKMLKANNQRHSGTGNRSRVDPEISRPIGDPNI